MELSSRENAHSFSPIHRLTQVFRDGNPRRRFAHVSPHLGKLGAVNPYALDTFARHASGWLGRVNGETLVIGLAESALLLAWWLAQHLEGEARLAFSSRESERFASPRCFDEPHSHGPQHFLRVPERRFARVIICEDELTTGATLCSLLTQIHELADRFEVLALSDMRRPEDREACQELARGLGIRLRVCDFSTQAFVRAEARPLSGNVFEPNPYGRSQAANRGGVETLERLWSRLKAESILMVGECVDVPLTFWGELDPSLRPQLHHVTRSPWRVDGAAIWSRMEFGGEELGTRYFLYNWRGDAHDRLLITCDRFTAAVAQQLATRLEEQGASVGLIEVPA